MCEIKLLYFLRCGCLMKRRVTKKCLGVRVKSLVKKKSAGPHPQHRKNAVVVLQGRVLPAYCQSCFREELATRRQQVRILETRRRRYMAAGRAHESGEVRKKIETAEERVVHLLRVHESYVELDRTRRGYYTRCYYLSSRTKLLFLVNQIIIRDTKTLRKSQSNVKNIAFFIQQASTHQGFQHKYYPLVSLPSSLFPTFLVIALNTYLRQHSINSSVAACDQLFQSDTALSHQTIMCLTQNKTHLKCGHVVTVVKTCSSPESAGCKPRGFSVDKQTFCTKCQRVNLKERKKKEKEEKKAAEEWALSEWGAAARDAEERAVAAKAAAEKAAAEANEDFPVPPLAVFLIAGCGADFLVNICLTLLGFIPGHIHAFYLEYVYFDRRNKGAMGQMAARPAPGVYSQNVQNGGMTQYGTVAA
ncbi:hypothetical protein MMC12_006211 [Toensbergia leucococca]|nr:hypothetical protein [Toensbergia leucococca]